MKKIGVLKICFLSFVGYNLLDKDRSTWQLPWKEEDMEEYCVCLSLLLRSFDGTVFKCIRFCQTLLFWYKETPENFSSSGIYVQGFYLLVVP